METTAIFTGYPTFEESKHNSLLLLQRNITELEKYLAGDCSQENYEFYSNIRDTQREHLRRMESLQSREELREGQQEATKPQTTQRPSRPNSHPSLHLP